METGVAAGVGDVIDDGEEERVAADNPGEGDGVVAQDATINADRSPMPADRCMRFALRC
ncbi:MAG: hypothetical protein Q7S35_02380 [Candidatus Limnocylindrales bacterium]|nr:hypothetical protein [Candidatus Limnocylindrales bacterium]